jgi:hypothetical protein
MNELRYAAVRSIDKIMEVKLVSIVSSYFALLTVSTGLRFATKMFLGTVCGSSFEFGYMERHAEYKRNAFRVFCM